MIQEQSIPEQAIRMSKNDNKTTGITSSVDAFSYHTELYESLMRPDATDISLREATTYAPGLSKEELNDWRVQLLRKEFAVLSTAQCIFVSHEISDEIIEARETMLDSVIIEQDVFTPNGIIVLEKPMYYSLTNAEAIETWRVSSIGYGVINNRLEVFVYGNLDRVTNPDNGETLMVYADSLKMLSHNITPENYEQVLGEYIDKTNVSMLMSCAGRKARLVDSTTFDFGETTTKYDPEILKLKKFILAFFRLTYQYLEIETDRPSRHARRRAERAKRPSDGYVVTLKLRRSKYDAKNGNHSSPEYAFRVRGHWKRVYLRSSGFPVGDSRAYKHMYIKDYIKGRGEFVESKRLVKVER